MLRLAQYVPQVGQSRFEVFDTVPPVPDGGVQVPHSIFKLVRCVWDQVAGLLDLVHHIMHLAG